MAHNISLYSNGRRLFCFLFFILLSCIGAGCRSYVPNEPELDEGVSVRTTIAGTVVDEDGMPIANVAIVAHGQSTVSNKFGYFILHKVLAPKHRAVVLAKQDGFFPASRAATTSENGLTEVVLNMMSYGTRTSVSASSGGIVRVTGTSGEAKVTFAPDGMTVNGSAYSGEARVAVRYLDPVESSFANYFSGDEAAIRESGENTMLVSYGVLRVDMRTPSGEMIQLAPGKPAEISYPVPSTLANAPESIPLWYFDEERGLWIEEGIAIKQGSNYIGTVKHFTDWNLDVPERIAYIKGSVVCGDRGKPGVVVRIGQVTIVTNDAGMFYRRVPANTQLNVKVELHDNAQMYESDVIVVPAIRAGEESTVHIQLTSGCPATITGMLTDGEGTMIPGSVTVVKANGKVRTSTSLDGSFAMMVQAESQSQLYMSSWVCGLQKAFTAQAGVSESIVDIGLHVICSDEPIVEDTTASTGEDTVGGTEGGIEIFHSDTMNARIALSQNGEYAAIASHGPVATVYNIKTGKLVSTTEVSRNPSWVNPPQFSEDGSKYLLNRILEGRRNAVIIETSTGKTLGIVPTANNAYIFPDGSFVLLWDLAGKLQKCSLTSASVKRTYSIANVPQFAQIQGISQDGKKAVLESEGWLYLFDLEQGRVALVSPVAHNFSTALSFVLSPDASVLSYVNFTNGMLVALGLATGQKISSGDMTVNDLYQYTYHPNGKHVLLQPMIDDFSSLSLVDFRTGKVEKVLPVPGRYLLCSHMIISRDGKRATGIFREGQKLTVRSWDL